MSTDVRLEQTRKVDVLMDVTESPMTTDARFEQDTKAAWPMDVTESGMSTVVRPQPTKAK